MRLHLELLVALLDALVEGGLCLDPQGIEFGELPFLERL
jgi:hypothetical protein